MYEEEKELEEAIAKKIFEQDIKLEDDKPSKQVCIAKVGSVTSWKTSDFTKLSETEDSKLPAKSAQDSQKSLAPN